MLGPMVDLPPPVQWRMTAAPGGWWKLDEAHTGASVYLQVQDDAEGWPRVGTAVMVGGAPIRPISWRDVPFDAVESFARAAPMGQFEDEENERARAVNVLGDLEAMFTRDLPSTDLAVFGGHRDIPSLRALKAPGSQLTDEFLAALAAAYNDLTAHKVAPAPAIAEQTGAPVRTVHGWVAEARKRKVLPPARRGRAG